MDKLIVLMIGVLLGMAIYAYAHKTTPVGILRVDRSDPSDEPYLFLELNQPVDMVTNKKVVTMLVKHENFISRD